MTRLLTAALAMAALSALALSAWTHHIVTGDQRTATLTSAEILEAMSEKAQEHAALEKQLQQEPFVEQGTGVLGSYLTKIRRDGIPAHAEMRQALNELSLLNVSLLTLVELYEPQARTPDFKKGAREFRSYALVWNDRRDTLMDYFMAGGNLPASEVPFPTHFAAAIEAERKATR